MTPTALYKDPLQPVSSRVEDLLSRMTLPEKVGQMTQLNASLDLDEIVLKKHAGSILHASPQRLPQAIDLAAKTRLGIPLLIADDCIHGHSFWSGATIFPTQLSMSSTWDPDLLMKAARVTAIEATSTGFKWTFSPVLCIARDLRWGRVGETFGEDPFLIGELASAMVRGYQGNGLNDPTAMLATAKHFAGYSETQGGRDASEADISRRKLKAWFLPPFERVALEGCRTFMTGYQSMDGVPTTANRWLLRDILKEEWGFDGILVTDWNNVGALVTHQKICDNYTQAAVVAIRSGNDLIMSTPNFFDGALDAVAKGLLEESEIDEVVGRILKLKFELGLFENPCRPDIDLQQKVIGCAEHRDLNLEIARRSLVLLKNQGILPLAAAPAKTIALIGPNADNPNAQLGDWAGASGQVSWIKNGHPRETIKTVFDGLREVAPAGWQVNYSLGCEITRFVDNPAGPTFPDGQPRPKRLVAAEIDPDSLADAVKCASAADVLVTVVGDNVHLAGESKSTATLELMGGQIAMLEALVKIGKPMIVVLINTKPLVLPQCVLNAAAIIEAFNPGMQGGRAIAELIFGQFEPSGRLAISFPAHVGQQPINYSQIRGQHGDRYADLTQEPVFAFGEGLSYTTFNCRDLRVLTPKVNSNETIEAEITVANTGARKGTQTIQFYISDSVTSVTWANMELKAYCKVELKPGEEKTVRVAIAASSCSIVNADCQRVVEPGMFELLAGPDSRERNLLRSTFEILQ